MNTIKNIINLARFGEALGRGEGLRVAPRNLPPLDIQCAGGPGGSHISISLFRDPESGSFPIVAPGFTFDTSSGAWLPFYFKDELLGVELCSDIPKKHGIRDPRITDVLRRKANELDWQLWRNGYTGAPRSSFYSPLFAEQVGACGVSCLD